MAERGRNTFATTHWSLVVAAGGPKTRESSAALEALCRIYWYPLYAYVRRFGYDVERAEDTVQAFFLHFLERQSLLSARQDRGRFRSFLLGCLKHFIANEYDRASALKRGGGQLLASLDVGSGEDVSTVNVTMLPAPPVDADDAYAVEQAVTSPGSERTTLTFAAQVGDTRVSATWLPDPATDEVDTSSLDVVFRDAVVKLRREG